MTAVLREEPARTNLEDALIPPGYQDIIQHCLEKDPENRFQSAKDLVFALQTLAGSAGVRPSSSKTRARTTPVLPWALVAVLAVATMLFAITQLLHTVAPDRKSTRLNSSHLGI